MVERIGEGRRREGKEGKGRGGEGRAGLGKEWREGRGSGYAHL